MPRLILRACFLLCALALPSQDSNHLHPTVVELPPEPIPTGTCKESYSGYLEVQEHRKAKDLNLTSQQVGDYVKKRCTRRLVVAFS
jgi:hypothetical protein